MQDSIVNREKLKEEMEKRDMNYGDLGRLLLLCRSSVCRKVSGEYLFKEAEIKMLVRIFGRSVLNL